MANEEATKIMGEPLNQSMLLYLVETYHRTIMTVLVLSAFYANALIDWWIAGNTNHAQSIALGATFLALPIALVSLVKLLLLLCFAIKKLFIGNYKKLQSRGVIRNDSCFFSMATLQFLDPTGVKCFSPTFG